MQQHQTIGLRLPRRLRTEQAQIDQQMAPLIRELWRLGFRAEFCCQGDPPVGAGMHSRAPEQGAEQPAYISFATALEALLFASLAGPPSWDRREDQRRSQAGDWQVWGTEVRFPGGDIGRAIAALQRHHWRLEALLGAALIGGTPHRSGEHGTQERLGAVDDGDLPLLSAPRRCPVCGGLRMSRRKNARYCSRRCQLAARDRRRITVDGVGVARGTEAAPVAMGTRSSGGEPEGPAEMVLAEAPGEGQTEATHHGLQALAGPEASAPGGAALEAEEGPDDAPHPEAPVVPAPPATETSVAVGGTHGAVSVAFCKPSAGIGRSRGALQRGPTLWRQPGFCVAAGDGLPRERSFVHADAGSGSCAVAPCRHQGRR